MKMKKYIQSMMAFAAIVSFASCSSEDNNTTIENESATKVMTFTATQEGNEASTRAILSGTNIHWESEDKISIFDGTNNNQFTLTGGDGSTSGKFSGEAEQSNSYTAVYPYQENASLSGDDVTNVTLPATQNATANSFDKEAALMITESGDGKTLNFKNVVGYVKVKPNFDCKRIDLKAFDNSAVLAGTGTVSYNGGEPKLDLSNAKTKDYAITLQGEIKAGNYYYIAVPPVTLKAGWSIKFTASDGTVYSRKGTKDITFTRNKVTNLGEFDINETNWYEPRGKIDENREVDLGFTIKIGTKNYKVIFANANLSTGTGTGLAYYEYDYGDYFAWGATKPWYVSYHINAPGGTPIVGEGPNWDKSGGYIKANAPYYNGSYTKYTAGKTLEAADDAANKILGGDWQIPTTEIWQALYDANTKMVNWEFYGNKVSETIVQGMKISKKDDSNTYIFLPAGGQAGQGENMGTSFYNVGSKGNYWSGTAADPNTGAYCLNLNFIFKSVDSKGNFGRYYGYLVRPVRLVAVD
ncbi:MULTISPECIES: hypothetical protein [unclassified Prevotella]|uniref:hypothetical protein n=1 Tax=unclassified Prevotella TaxID=2638335 RepID=UPI0013037EBD|nr:MULTISPECIES: hypothetical protein [unclassified Prevotella]